MYLAFEFLFYAGLILIAIGFAWLLTVLLRRRPGQSIRPILLLLLGFAAIAAPAIYTRLVDVDLGPRLVLVHGERHITLTGWDRDDYSVLRAYPETIVLQIANPDVTDGVLSNLSLMANLRELDLNDTQVTDDGLAELVKLTGLEVVRLRATKITDDGLDKHLSRLPRLKRLDLRETGVTDDAAKRWKDAGEGRRLLR